MATGRLLTPPQMDGTQLSLRFKHGLHTVFLFIDPLQPVSAVTAQLLDALRERYPEGELRSSQGPTPIPGPDAETTVVYGKLKNPGDAAEGWQRLELKDGDTLSRKGVTDGSVLAFAFADDDEGAEDVEFAVDWPSVDEYDGDDTLEAA